MKFRSYKNNDAFYFDGVEFTPVNGTEYDGRISYFGLAAIVSNNGGMVMNNHIMNAFPDDWELYSGNDMYDDSEYKEVYQTYIISERGAETLKNIAPSEIVYHNDEIGMYVWGITHFGTSWDYVATEIKIELE